jgi:PleD family two-component response regulator
MDAVWHLVSFWSCFGLRIGSTRRAVSARFRSSRPAAERAAGEIGETVLKPRGGYRDRKGASVRVLVIEDDEELGRDGRRRPAHARMAVDVALDGEAGLARALVNDYDVIVLDRDLPGLHGDEVCARLVAPAGAAGC